MKELLVFLVLLVPLCFGAKILMVPFPIKSHVRTMIASGQTLVKDGHDVVIIAADDYETTITQKGMTAWCYPGKLFNDLQDSLSEKTSPLFAKGEIVSGMMTKSKIMTGALQEICESILGSEELMGKIDSYKFNLAIIEGAVLQCVNIIPYKYDIPFILYGPFSPPWASGVPSMPSFEPMTFLTNTANMNFFQRISNLFGYVMFHMIPVPDELVKKHAPNKPQLPLREIAKKAEMVLMYFEQWCLDYPRVSAPNYQFIGSGSAKPAQPLPEDLESFANSAQHGLIIMSYGSVPEFRQALLINLDKFLDAFRKIPQKVLIAIKCDGFDVPVNVRCLSWMPQNDLLGHPKTVLFISHGGTNGQIESIGHGVPMICIGVMSEQIYNSIRADYHGYGKQLYLHEFTPDDLINSIDEVVSNDKYRTNTRKCASIIKSFPSADENFVFWVNHILEFGGSHLRPVSLDLSYYQLFMLDILAVMFLGVLLITVVCFCACRFLVKKCCKKQDKLKSE